MNKATTIVIVASLLVALAWPAGAPAGESTRSHKADSRSLEFGLGIRVGAEWISLNGTWSLGDNRDGGSDNSSAGFRVHEVRIGAVPNMFRQAQKGLTLFRALRTTYVCLAKQWLSAQADYHDPQGR